MKKNEIYTVECLDMTNQGYGVVRIQNQVVFVSGLLKSEVARIKILKVLKNYAFGKIEELITFSVERTKPLCKKAFSCGGCSFQHLSYEKQLEVKTEYVRQLFQKNHITCPVEKTLGMKEPYYYRNKAQFPIQVQKDQVVMGFYRPHSNSIVECEECVIQSHEINTVYQYIRKKLTPSMAKGLRHVLLRSNEKGQVQIVFIGSQNHVQPIVQDLLKQFGNIVSILFNQNDRKDNVILGDAYTVLHGHDYMEQYCMQKKVKLHFKSFFQVNSKQMEVLYQMAIDLAQLDKEQTVIDLYSGVGTISCVIAPYVKKVIGVEIVAEAVEDAKENAALNQLDNVSFVCEDASQFISRYKEPTDVVFVDPPRKGLTSTGIEHITSLKPQKVIYISCNPNTMVRDIQLFEDKGYRCQKVRPVDMFCQTQGLECVTLLERV